jgi:hypothetical protein
VLFIHQNCDRLWGTIKATAPELLMAWHDCGLLDERGQRIVPSGLGSLRSGLKLIPVACSGAIRDVRDPARGDESEVVDTSPAVTLFR